jgi:uncharacterized protein YceH (UPF0502 family)
MQIKIQLDDIEVRVLASLIEKQITTPAYYPLTLKALTAACNQKSSRDPVVVFDEKTVVRGVEGLLKKGLVERIIKADSRVPKYQHLFTASSSFAPGEVAVLCELMLRGGQTPGEVRSRAGRLYRFSGMDEVEAILNGMMERDEPVVRRLPRQPGRKERRYIHLFSGYAVDEEPKADIQLEPATLQVINENDRIALLEERLELLTKEVETLKKAFDDFTSEFS